MFGLFSSVEKQMRTTAQHWLELGEKVYAYRRDVLSEADRNELNQRLATLRTMRKERADASRLKLGTEALEATLRRTGGKFYPRSTFQEYVEFFIVAAIVILGIRAYFVQPFKIPTNSMWPTYYGMTSEVYKTPAEVPGTVAKTVRFLAFGAVHKDVVAPASGAIRIPVHRRSGRLLGEMKPGKKWFVFPTTVKEHVIAVGDKTVAVQVPQDFNFDLTIAAAYGVDSDKLALLAEKSTTGNRDFAWVELPGKARAGENLFSFDLMTGDQLFVERVSYHFFRPQVGQGFVFRTGNIDGIGSDQYYIKRLAGEPGDTLEIKDPVLYRNGQPIEGAEAFQLNANRTPPYRGYVSIMRRGSELYLGDAGKIKVPNDGYYALGDNSRDSQDSRYWGHVPYKDVVGRPLFIYYPFTKRFGPAK